MGPAASRISWSDVGETKVRIGRRDIGAVSIMLMSRMPASDRCSVRGMGVAESVRTSTWVRSALMRSFLFTLPPYSRGCGPKTTAGDGGAVDRPGVWWRGERLDPRRHRMPLTERALLVGSRVRSETALGRGAALVDAGCGAYRLRIAGVIRDYGMAMFNPTMATPIRLARGETWTAALRVAAYDGELTDAAGRSR